MPTQHEQEFAKCPNNAPLSQTSGNKTCERYTQELLQSSFISTHLGTALGRLNHSKAIPDGLKPQECEQNAGQSKPHIPCIPVKDVIQEALDTTTNTLKLTLPHKVELRVPVWSQATPSSFWYTSSKSLIPSGRKVSIWPISLFLRKRRRASRS